MCKTGSNKYTKHYNTIYSTLKLKCNIIYGQQTNSTYLEPMDLN